MFHGKTILIVDDPLAPTMILTPLIERQRGTVAGPVATRQTAIACLERQRCDVAVVDANLPDAANLIRLLAESRLPYVLHAAGPICPDMARTSQGGAALFRPVDPAIVMTMIAIALEKGASDQPEQNRMPPVQG